MNNIYSLDYFGRFPFDCLSAMADIASCYTFFEAEKFFVKDIFVIKSTTDCNGNESKCAWLLRKKQN